MKYLAALLMALAMTAQAGIIPPTYNGIIESGDELWTVTDIDNGWDDSGFEMIIRKGQHNTFDHEFGFYHYDFNSGSIASTLAIFDASFNVGDSTNVVFDFANNSASTMFGSMDLSLASGLNFGFYFISDGTTYYSQEKYNNRNKDHFGFYWETNPYMTTDLYIFMNDGGRGTGYDEMMVGANDVRPIPEPPAIALLAFGLIGIAAKKRIKFFKSVPGNA